jgi:uncharacterized protein
MAVLIDTNVLLALVFPKDIHHQEARSDVRDIKDVRIVPAPVLPELFQMDASKMSYVRAIQAFNLLRTGAFEIEELTDTDMARMQEIMMEYADNEFDFADVAIMALAERLQITDVYTFDQRDFNAFRPRHRLYLRLLP